MRALAVEMHENWLEAMRYLDMDHLAYLQLWPSNFAELDARNCRCNIVPSPQPQPLADAVTLSCKLAKASLPGEG